MDSQDTPKRGRQSQYTDNSISRLPGRHTLDNLMAATAMDVQAKWDAEKQQGIPTKRAFTIKEVAQLGGWTDYQVRKAIEKGDIQANLVSGGGSLWLIPREEVLRILFDEESDD